MAVSQQERKGRPSVISFERQFSQKEVEEQAQRLIRTFKREIVREKEAQEFKRSIELGDRVFYLYFIAFEDNQQLIVQSSLRGITEESLFVRLRRRKWGEPSLVQYYHWRGGRVGRHYFENSNLAVQKAEDFLTRLRALTQPQATAL